MRFAIGSRFNELRGRVVVVDDSAWSPWSVNLDHHVGGRTPDRWVADVATAVALRALTDGFDPSEFRWLTVRHFDADGCLAAWSLLNPAAALEYRDLLIAAARYGDFYEAENCRSHGDAVWIASYLQDWLMRAHPAASLHDLYAHGFEVLPALLADAPVAGAAAAAHVSALASDRASVAKLTPRRHERFVLLETPVDLCLGALASTFQEPVLALWADEGRGWRYRILLRPRCSWGYAESAVGPVPLRDLRPLWLSLRRLERRAGGRARWMPAAFDGGIWEMRTADGSSALAPEIVEREVLGLLASRPERVATA